MLRHNVPSANRHGHGRFSTKSLKFTLEISARVDMKILQLIAVNFSGRDILYHSVFERIKECVMSTGQDIDFVLYALNVIRTILEDAEEDARRWISADCADEAYHVDHTMQFAVFVMETYANTEAAELARGILQALNVDVAAAMVEYGSGDVVHFNQFGPLEAIGDAHDDDDDVIDGLQPTANGPSDGVCYIMRLKALGTLETVTFHVVTVN